MLHTESTQIVLWISGQMLGGGGGDLEWMEWVMDSSEFREGEFLNVLGHCWYFIGVEMGVCVSDCLLA